MPSSNKTTRLFTVHQSQHTGNPIVLHGAGHGIVGEVWGTSNNPISVFLYLASVPFDTIFRNLASVSGLSPPKNALIPPSQRTLLGFGHFKLTKRPIL